MTAVIPEGARLTKCSSCGAPIFWAKTPAGKNCPFNAVPDPIGRYVVGATLVSHADSDVEPYTQMLVFDIREDRGEPRYDSHFASCPNASKHSRKGRV